MLNYFDDLAKRTYLVTNKSKDWNILKVFTWWFAKLMSPMM
jgi:hypothetical protein